MASPHIAARTLRVDATTVEVVRGFRTAALEPILLKGPSFADWLYGDGTRSYGDTDLLVAVEQSAAAGRVLGDLGFTPTRQWHPTLGWQGAHAVTWTRAADGAVVDLHTTIWEVADRQRLWSVLSTRTVPLALGSSHVTQLDEAGRVLQVVLHWVHHDDEPQPRRDLGRALALVDDSAWLDGLALAAAVGAEEPFLQGLASHPDGRALLRQLDVSVGALNSPALLLVLRHQSSTGAITVERIATSSSWRTRIALVIRILAPPPELVRPLEGGSPSDALLVVYGRRWCRLMRRAPTGLTAWLSARRAVNRRASG